jgi:hypothetical protein
VGVDQRAIEVLQRLHIHDSLKGEILTLGRQHIDYESPLLGSVEWLDQTLKSDSLDVSNYEDATIVWDLQNTVPDDLQSRYDLILDFGTTEHIFDMAAVQNNIHSMLKPGGMYVALNGRTGWCSHGLYQFTPEFGFVVAEKYNYAMQCFTVEYGVEEATWALYETYGHDPRTIWKMLDRMTYLVLFMRKGGESDSNKIVQSLRYDEYLHRTGEAPIAEVSFYSADEFTSIPLPELTIY